jgi:uncharacterized membrane protein YhaH (DUF805 family)
VRASFWQWFGVCFIFAATPFALKFVVGRSYGESAGALAILGNGDLCLMSSLLSCSALLELFLARRRDSTEAAGLFLITLAIAIFSIGYYAAVSKAFPNPQTADSLAVAVLSGATYLSAVTCSWFSGRVADQGRAYGRG